MRLSQSSTAALLAIAASAILSFIDNFVLAVSQEAGLWQFQVVRALIAVPVVLLWAKAFDIPIWPRNFGKTVLRSLLVSAGLLIYFASLGVLPVAQAGAGLFSAPIWVLLFSALVFRVQVSFSQAGLIAVGFGGVLLLLQPDLSTLSILSFLPIFAGALYGLGMLATRHVCAGEHALTLAVGVFLTIGLVSLVLLIFFTLTSETEGFLTRGWVAPSLRFFYLTAFQAIGAVIAVSLISQAYRIGVPSQVAVFEYSFLIFAAIWAYLLWGHGVNALSIIGIALILFSGAVLSLIKRSTY